MYKTRGNYVHKVFWHGGCPDGFGAALVAWTKLGYGAVYEGIGYHNNFWQKLSDLGWNDIVYLVDFCLPLNWIIRLSQRVQMVVILDHHDSRERDLLAGIKIPNVFGRYGTNRSGVGLAWEWWYPNEPMPMWVQHLQDRDLWLKEIKGTDEVVAALMSYRMEFETWYRLVQDLPRLYDEGKHVLRSQKQAVESMTSWDVVWATIDGHYVPVVNTKIYFSDAAEALLKRFPEAPFAAYYYDTSSGRRWGLRGREGGMAVNTIAMKWHGGGHKLAAGLGTSIDDIELVPER